MTHHYLSSAFQRRTEEEIDFLKSINTVSGFLLFWIDIVRPLLCHIDARHLLEIGADLGTHTRLLACYCNSVNGTLTVIEPFVKTELNEFIGRSGNVKLVEAKSRDALPILEGPVDAVLLEGDLNYHTVYGDLSGIADMAERCQTPFPIVFLRATGWPYARRDMYYDPDGLPEHAVHAFRYCGMTHWSPDLVQDMINQPFANAEKEGGVRNGVLTAVEDFVRDTSLALRLFTLPVHNGLSIVYSQGSTADTFIRDRIASAPLLVRLLETVEVARLNSIIKHLESLQAEHLAAATVRSRIERKLHRIIERFFTMIKKRHSQL
ncbi:MAG TPA: class I SAM-dependent methyltransferase [Syntrophales bacterium]|nr:class I SAM-dependent methyltransferase [Syntrophales bacterium]